MRTSDADILVLPGLGGGTPEHWYRRWLSKLRTAREVVQQDWNKPEKDAWTDTVLKSIADAERPVVLICHSLGAITAVHSASKAGERIAGAYLVAPVSIEHSKDALPEIVSFGPVPTDPLPFPSVLVSSTNDPYCPVETAEDYSYAWGAKFETAGESGHINDESGQGPWPEGLLSFANFMSRL